MTTTKKKIIAVIAGIFTLALGILCIVVVSNIVLPILGLILVSLLGQQPATAPEVFPQADIIYAGWDGVSFVNADGSGRDVFHFQTHSRSVLDESRDISFLVGDYQTLVTVNAFSSSFEGEVYVTRPGEKAVDCGWTGTVQFIADPAYLLIATDQSVEKYRITDCGTRHPPEQVWNASGAISLDERYSAETRWITSQDGMDSSTFIVLHDLMSGEQKIMAEGDFPSWSRDGQWLAYTGVDGIYVVGNNPEAEPRRVAKMEGSEVFPLYDDWSAPTAASWSPDGHWLVYHEKRDKTTLLGSSDSYYVIVKVNVETGETVDLLKDGKDPRWIWPVEEP